MLTTFCLCLMISSISVIFFYQGLAFRLIVMKESRTKHHKSITVVPYFLYQEDKEKRSEIRLFFLFCKNILQPIVFLIQHSCLRYISAILSDDIFWSELRWHVYVLSIFNCNNFLALCAVYCFVFIKKSSTNST